MVNKVIVTVKVQGNQQIRDIELPAHIYAFKIADLLGKTLIEDIYLSSYKVKFYLKSESLGRFLEDEETLFDAGVWDGDSLILSFS